MFGMEIINKALDALPPGSPDHMWLSHVSEHAATTPHSVVMMAHQTALSVLGLNDGRFALPSAEPGPAGTATPPQDVFTDPGDPEGLTLVVLEKTEDGTFGTPNGSVPSVPTAADYAEPAPVVAPPVEEPSYAAPSPDEPAIGDTTAGGLDDHLVLVEVSAEADPVVVEDRLAPRAYVAADNQGLTEGIIAPPVIAPHIAAPLVEEPDAVDSLSEFTPPVGVAADRDTVFGSVPFEVSDALYANETNGKPKLDLVIFDDAAKAASVDESAAVSEPALLAEGEALAKVAAEYVPSPLPLIPGLPAMETEQFIGSEPVSS